MNTETSDELLRQQIREIACPIHVDVVDKVMQQVSQLPLPAQKPVIRPVRRIWLTAGSVAACIAVAFAVHTAFSRDATESAINDMFTDVYYYSDECYVDMMACEELSDVEELINQI